VPQHDSYLYNPRLFCDTGCAMQPGNVPRAPRLPLRAPIALRIASASDWAQGWTVNISRSGVLFALPSRAEVSGELEFVITLSRGALNGPGVRMLPDLHCRGHVVRLTSGQGGETMIAANIRRQLLKKARLAN
jgi:hypothetical protein